MNGLDKVIEHLNHAHSGTHDTEPYYQRQDLP